MLTILKKGIFTENPVFVQALGLCPLLAVTVRLYNGLGMGIAYVFALMLTNLIISLVAKFIPNQVRIPAYIVIIAGVVTAIDLYLQAFMMDLHSVLGIFIPLIAVNCIVLGRAEAFASKNGAIRSVVDGFAAGVGLTLALALLAFFREGLGSGTLMAGTDFVIQVLPDFVPRIEFMLSPPGAFITLGVLMAGLRYISNRRNRSKEVAN
ncbi:MAG: electron transport complex subunit RsxE [Defluviitaleaceae bacterium]|nr:electron transport complex subunit RsxE [Defluviitaleaceae bacterium]